MSNLVTIRRFYNPNETGIISSRLKDEGITCFVQDELMSQGGGYSAATGGAKLQVCEEDVERAVQILLEGGYITEKDIQEQEPSKFESWLYRLFHRNNK